MRHDSITVIGKDLFRQIKLWEALRPNEEEVQMQRRESAVYNVQRGELSKARRILTAAALAPGTSETLGQLTDPARRPPHLERPVPAQVLQHSAVTRLKLDTKMFFEALRGARKGSAAGLSGMAISHLKPLLENEQCMDLLGCAADLFAAAEVPTEVSEALALARLTSLSKPNGGVRGIATGDTFRRLVSRALARQFAQKFNEATSSFQFALQTRAGTDCLAGLLRAATDLEETATITCLDGIGAFDHISRAAFLSKLQEVVPSLVPFVLQFYGRTSTYYWWDDSGTRHTILQGEGCEQGDALAPALFALAMHGALLQAQSQLQPGEYLAAFLDDIYLVTQPSRVRAAFDSTTAIIQYMTGMRTNMGKCRIFNRTGSEAPLGIRELGEDVWCSNKPLPSRGLLVLGSPIGSPEFIHAHTQARMIEENKLLAELPMLSDLQCSWLLLLFCAEPRANHLLRTLPPTLSRLYAQAHDDALWQCLQTLLGETDDENFPAQYPRARDIASLPAHMGGLGLRSATLHAPAAYWAGWADALFMLAQRQPVEAQRITQNLMIGGASQAACLSEASAAGRLLVEEGFSWIPPWQILLNGERPPPPDDNVNEPGMWNHGWQYYASLYRNIHFRSMQVLPSLDDASCALLRSQSGPQAGSWLTALPTEDATTMPPLLFQVALRRRLRLPLPMRPRFCGNLTRPGCGCEVDAFGDHETACPRTGLLGRRGRAVEQAWIKIAREAVSGEGQVVPQQWMSNIAAQEVAHDDRRRLDLVIYGASPAGHVLCCDATL